MLAVMNADFVAFDDSNILIIPGFHLSELRIAFLTVAFSVLIIIHPHVPLSFESFFIILRIGLFILQIHEALVKNGLF